MKEDEEVEMLCSLDGECHFLRGRSSYHVSTMWKQGELSKNKTAIDGDLDNLDGELAC